MPTYNLPPSCTPEMALIVLQEQEARRNVEPREEGARDWRRGRSRSANPYPMGSVDYKNWQVGFDSARLHPLSD
jgi:hypothetical protein